MSTLPNLRTATEMAARLSEIAAVVEAAGVEPRGLSVTGWQVDVQCGSADEVDTVMGLLDVAPSKWLTDTTYSRWATFDEVVSVLVYGPKRPGCSCGQPCDHASTVAPEGDPS